MFPLYRKLYGCYLIFLTIGTSFSFSPCGYGYVRQELGWYSTVCCKRIECRAGTYVKTCTENYGNDTCEACPPGTFLLDNTNSDFAVECFPIPSCPEGKSNDQSETIYEDHMHIFEMKRNTEPVNYFSPTGCRLPCLCNTSRNRYGRDPCRCYVKFCPQGTFLTLDGDCNNTRPSEEPPTGAVYILR